MEGAIFTSTHQSYTILMLLFILVLLSYCLNRYNNNNKNKHLGGSGIKTND